MSMKAWVFGIFFCVLGGANAGIVFSVLESRFTAALVAGGGFVLVGLYLISLVWSADKPWLWVTFYTGHIHLVLISIPMIWARVSSPETPFAEIRVLGLDGPDFHQYSAYFYQLMLLGVVVDSARYYYFRKTGNLSKVSQA